MDIKAQMNIDFADSGKVLTKNEFNDRFYRAEAKIKYASTRMINDDVETQENIATYLKGKFVEGREYRRDGSIISNKGPSKYKLIRMVKEMQPEKSIASLKRVSKAELISMVNA
jgi:hypothetical protein